MSGWMNQLQSLLGQKGSSSGEQGLSKLLVPGALGGLAGLLVANKSSRKLLTKYGTARCWRAEGLLQAPSYGTNTKTRCAARIRMNRSTGSRYRR